MRILSKILVAAMLLGLLAGCGGTAAAVPDELGTMTVLFPSLGSADGAIILTEDTTVVIDTGEAGDGAELLALLQEHGRTSVELLIISHYDKDHVGGAAELLAGISVKRVIGSTFPKDSDEVTAYQQALAQAGLQEEVLSVDTTLTFGGLQLLIDKPNQGTYEEDQSNNSSLVVTVTFGDTKMLFAGDAMAERLAEINWDTYDLIKIPHHGRDAAEAAQYIDAFAPGGYAVITSSKSEKESKELLSILETAGITVYRTRKGAVTAVSDGTTLTVTQA